MAADIRAICPTTSTADIQGILIMKKKLLDRIKRKVIYRPVSDFTFQKF